jgi:hypothetical protein
MTYKTIYTEVEVDVDIGDFDTQDLIDELDARGELPAEASYDAKELLHAIWLKRRQGNDNYQQELDQLIWQGLGKII